ncbi:MAG: diacylglycerol acyltransferase-domain-containing protein [Monoraphidium minutum]|nr:MAG: diacylglycerol acyltransferase-domain-containing protein [Monoraphidium minutum]
MLPSLGAAVAAWPLAPRAAAYCAMWTGYALGLQLAVEALGGAARLPKLTKAPGYSRALMLAMDAQGFLSWFAAAWLNPSWGDWSYSANFIALFWYQVPYMMLYDTFFFFVHRACHKNKLLFRYIHGTHHDMRAVLDVSTTGRSFITPQEGVLFVGLPLGCVAAAAWFCLGRSWWYLAVPVHTTMTIFILGHCGWHLTMDKITPDALLFLLNPFQAVAGCTANAARPIDHQNHHLRPNSHYALFFTFWDDLFQTSPAAAPPHHPPPLMALNLAYYAVLWAAIAAAYYRPAAFLAILAAHLLAPPGLEEKLLGGAPRQGLARLAVWDRLRAAYGVGFAAPGERGAFDPEAAAAAAAAQRAAAAKAGGPPAAAAAVRAISSSSSSGGGGSSDGGAEGGPEGSDGGISSDDGRAPSLAAAPAAAAAARPPTQRPAQPRFVFGYHPVGFLSRGALNTFALTGVAGPAGRLPRVKLAVAGGLLRLPGVRQALLLAGCVDASYGTLLRLLTSEEAPASVAVTPGGWREAARAGSYRLTLRRRLGFVKLAAEAGAALVPVLGVGEPEITGPAGADPFMRWLICHRPRPLKVVFGAPVAPLPREPLPETQARYITSLQALAAEHGVALEIVE